MHNEVVRRVLPHLLEGRPTEDADLMVISFALEVGTGLNE